MRAAHQTELAEDYVEMIYELINEKVEARAVDLAIRFGGKYQIDGKTYTTWRMKKVGQGQGHYTWTDIPAGKVGGEEQRCHVVYKDKSTLPFQDAQWFPGLIGHVNDRGNDENYVYEPITEKNEIPSNFSDYEDKIFPDWAPKR